jgi:hypothetical protein
MKRTAMMSFTLLAIVFLTVTTVWAGRGQPNFSPALYADGELWGTKATTTLPPPNDHNLQSFDKLFAITNGAPGQLPVGEAAPGNPNYNGGRWSTHTVMWTVDGMDYYIGNVPVLMSYEEIEDNYDMGFLAITPGSPNPPTPPDYFQCPLLPVK